MLKIIKDLLVGLYTKIIKRHKSSINLSHINEQQEHLSRRFWQYEADVQHVQNSVKICIGEIKYRIKQIEYQIQKLRVFTDALEQIENLDVIKKKVEK